MSGIVGGINLRSSGLVNISSATDGQVFTGTGAGLPVGFEAAAGGGFTYVDEEDTTSGSSKTLETFDAGTSLIHIFFDEVSLDAINNFIVVQLEDAEGVETSGYVATAERTHDNVSSSTDGFRIDMAYTAGVCSGIMTLGRVNTSHHWVASYTGKERTGSVVYGGGSKTLSAELTKIVVKTAGGSFDAGSVRAIYI